jgi:type IV pilus assembly protein PilC
MPVFNYRARERGGEIITSGMEATSRQDVAEALRDRGYFISEVKAHDSGLESEITLT